MTGKIPPALTPREWTDPLPLFDQFIRPGTVRETITERLHGLAAVCLHEHSYGFTWEMVDAIRLAVEAVGERGALREPNATQRQFEERYRRLSSEARTLSALADRIEALLPPREPDRGTA